MSFSLQDAWTMFSLRTGQPLDTYDTMQKILDRLTHPSDPINLLKGYRVHTLHSLRRSKGKFEVVNIVEDVLSATRNEPRVYFGYSGNRFGFQAEINCESEIVKEVVDGKLQEVPKASQISSIHLSAHTKYLMDLTNADAILDLLSDIFVIIQGEYGWGRQLEERDNDYDFFHRNRLEPSIIVWANFFGPKVVEKIGIHRIMTAPAHSIRSLSNEGVLLVTTPTPVEYVDEGSKGAKRRVEAALYLHKDIYQRIREHLGILTPSERDGKEAVEPWCRKAAEADRKIMASIAEAYRQVRENTAPEMRGQAEGCVEGVKKFWGIKLDYSADSLKEIERLIREGFRKEEEEETIETAVQAFGAYVGEVVRLNVGGEWLDEEMKGQPILLGVGEKKLRVDPFKTVRSCFSKARQGKACALREWYDEINPASSVS